jgi:hypothetical protein
MRVTAIVVAFVGLSLVTDRSSREQRTFSGNILRWRVGEYITVSQASTDLRGFTIGLHRNTVIDGNLESGARVTVWYRNVAERRLMADRVRVLHAASDSLLH